MATRYFKKENEREVCTTSSGNRSKIQPDAPGYPYGWIEIERKEFIKLRRKIVSGRTSRALDGAACPDCKVLVFEGEETQLYCSRHMPRQ